MEWEKSRLSTRLSLRPEIIEQAYGMLAEINSVKNSWRLTGRLLLQTIERLTQSVIITSTGASNRIEGNKLSDIEVETLYKNLSIKKFKTRDEQEVAGYLEMLQIVFEQYEGIKVSESTILQFHNDMLRHSEKDERYRGKYKFGSNRVEAKDASGNLLGVIFDPTLPHLTQKEMQELVTWYDWADGEELKHPLILIANFIYEYLSIHPFQDGNGRASRLLTNMLLLQHGYDFIAVASHEKLVEDNKVGYYDALTKSQKSWKGESEDISSWLMFFLKTVQSQAQQALAILEGDNTEYLLSEKQLAVWQWANASAREFSRKEAIDALGFPARTVEASIKKLLDMKKLEKLGEGRATRYKVVV